MSVPEKVDAPMAHRLSAGYWFAALVGTVVVMDYIMGIAAGFGPPDIFVFSLSSYFGLQLMKRTGQPLWFRVPAKRWARVAAALAGVLAAGLTAYFTGWLSISSHTGLPDQILGIASTPVRGAAMALRAGITEEILFRFTLGGVIMLGVQQLTLRIPRWTKPATIVLTGLAFCLVHANPVGFVCGTLLAFIYFETGLVPAMVVHFLADLVVWGFMIPLFY